MLSRVKADLFHTPPVRLERPPTDYPGMVIVYWGLDMVPHREKTMHRHCTVYVKSKLPWEFWEIEIKRVKAKQDLI